jgi:hypothetical protein
MPRSPVHKWVFVPRFRRHAFGWRSQPAVQRVREATTEIQKAAKKDPALGAAGAVLFLEKVSAALEQVDSSSGVIGTAVNHAIEACASIIAKAPVDDQTRDQWLDRLWEAHQSDQIPYIERLGHATRTSAPRSTERTSNRSRAPSGRWSRSSEPLTLPKACRLPAMQRSFGR